jgi:hypothetical protein
VKKYKFNDLREEFISTYKFSGVNNCVFDQMKNFGVFIGNNTLTKTYLDIGYQIKTKNMNI